MYDDNLGQSRVSSYLSIKLFGFKPLIKSIENI